MEKTFELKKVKIGFLGADCKYNLIEKSDEGVTTENSYHVKDSRPIHEDLVKLFADLAVFASVLFGWESTRDGIAIDAIAFSGKDDNAGAVLSGTYDTKAGPIKFKTPCIKFNGEWDMAAELSAVADVIVNEVNAYLFEGKHAQMEVFGE